MFGCACVRIGLAAAVLALAVSPTALAFAEKPKPDALWEAFPLQPTPERASTPAPAPAPPLLLPPSTGRAEATAVAEPSEASGPGIMVFAFAATLLLVGVLSGRRFYLGKRHRRTTVPLWQGAALPLPSGHEPQRHESGIRTSSAPVGHEPGDASEPDFLAPLYRWVEVEKPPASSSPSSLGSVIRKQTHRFRRDLRNRNIVSAIIGAAAAVVSGVLVVYLIG